MRGSGPRLLALTAAGALLVAVGWPLVRLAGALDLTALRVLAAPATLRTLANTMILSGGTTLFAVVVGTALALLVGRANLPGARALTAALLVPYLVPPYVMAIAWIALANPTSGLLNRPFGRPVVDVYGLVGMIWVMGLETTPLVLLVVDEAARRADPALEEAARISGAGRIAVLWRITLPLLAPAIAEAGGLVFAHVAASFSVPYLLSTGQDQVLTTRIYQLLALSPATGRAPAVALSILLLAAGLLPIAPARALARRWGTTPPGGKAARSPRLELGWLRWGVSAAVGGWALAAAALPLGTLVATSLLTSYGRGFSLSNIGFATWGQVFARSETRSALLRSFELGSFAACAATILGFTVVILHERGRVPGGRALVALARLPFAIPGTVLALGMLLAWSQEIRLIVAGRVTFALALADTGWLLGLAYTVKYLAVPIASATAGVRAIDRSLEEAARISGATALGAWRTVTLPLLRGNLVSSWLLVFVPAFTEVTQSVLLSGPDTRVVGVVLFDLQTYGDPPAAAVLAVVTAGVALAGNAMLRLARREV